jgi:hypothetical protein
MIFFELSVLLFGTDAGVSMIFLDYSLNEFLVTEKLLYFVFIDCSNSIFSRLMDYRNDSTFTTGFSSTFYGCFS